MAATWEVAIVGGGPAGLATAIALAQRGISAVVLERRAGELDKACGEGLMPGGMAVLEQLGVQSLLPAAQHFRFGGIRYVQEDGSFAEGRLPGGGGLGIRRTALISALQSRARSLGIALREGWSLQEAERVDGHFRLRSREAELRARLLVAADGLHSPLRKQLGLELPQQAPARFGLRRHFLRAPWSDCVEIHLSSQAEAYLTPVGPGQVGVAFLWERGRVAPPISFERMLSQFPILAEKLGDCLPCSAPMGAGPFLQSAREQVTDQAVLIGDAAGYVDPITGEGLSLALRSAQTLAKVLPHALARGASRSALLPYQNWHQAAFRGYAQVAHAVLALSRRPRLRRILLGQLGRWPWLFERLLDRAL